MFDLIKANIDALKEEWKTLDCFNKVILFLILISAGLVLTIVIIFL